jgi:hypothetical protein
MPASFSEDEGYAFTEISSPAVIDRLLDKNSFLVDKWDRMTAWHKAQWDWHHDQFAMREAKAIMRYDGPVGKAKYAAQADDDVVMARTYLGIAKAQLTICEHRLHSLSKEGINLATRNKALMQSYAHGGGTY